MTRSRAPLALMEQVVMILVFALAAALCLQVFVLSNRISHLTEDETRAAVLAQEAAERLKAAGGDVSDAQQAVSRDMGGTISQGLWYICYDQNWQETSGEEAFYQLEVQGVPASPEEPLLSRVRVEVFRMKTGRSLFSLTAAWQRGGPQ